MAVEKTKDTIQETLITFASPSGIAVIHTGSMTNSSKQPPIIAAVWKKERFSDMLLGVVDSVRYVLDDVLDVFVSYTFSSFRQTCSNKR